MIFLRPGELKERIDILNVREPFDINWVGTVVSTFAAGVRAKIIPQGSDIIESTQETQTGRQAYSIWIRYREGITAFQQIDWDGRRLVLTGPPEEIFRRRWLLIHAEERTSRNISQ
jgi:head-tail adaptor